MSALAWAKFGAFLALSLLLLASGWTVLILGHHVEFTLAKVDRTFDEINRPCGLKQSCGTLADVNKTLGTIRGTVGQIEIAARHEDRQLSTLDAQEKQLFTDIHSTAAKAQDLTTSLTATSNGATAALDTLNTDLKTLDTTITDAQPVLASVANTADSAARTTNRLNEILQSPAIPETLTNVQGMTANGNRILKDGADEADKLVHPPKAKMTFWGALWLTEQKVKQALPPLF